MGSTFAKIADDVVLGKNVVLPGFCNLYGCQVGDDVTIGTFVEIQRDVRVGDRVKIQSHSFLCSGVRLEDEVFVGHGVMFINDRVPRATTTDGRRKAGADWVCTPTLVKKRASIGSNATILCGVTIGENAVIGAGSVVTRDVPPNTVVAGNPARLMRRVRPEDEREEPAVSESRAVPFMDLREQHQGLRGEILEIVSDALDRAEFIGGTHLPAFESEFAAFVQCKHAIGVASGTDALRFALLALGVGPGATVATVPNTFIATAAAITQAGGDIAFVDVDPDTCLMDLNRLEDLLKRRGAQGSAKRVGVILPVHLYGQCVDMPALLALADRHGAKVLEDAAQAHGATWNGKPAGSWGHAAAFSFYPGKNLGACGEGGAVTTNSADIADRVRLLRDHGRRDRYSHVLEGYNGRLDGIQAGILRLKLKKLPEWNERRNNLSSLYDRRLSRLPGVRPVRIQPECSSSRHLYVLCSKRRDALQAHLRSHGIGTSVHYPIPLHLQPAYQRLGIARGAFPQAERSCAEALSLPLFPELAAADVDRVCAAVENCISLGLDAAHHAA